MSLRSINPATGELRQEFMELTAEEIKHKLALAETAFNSWKQTSFHKRAERMSNLSAYLLAHKNELGKLITEEMGKPISAAIAEVEKCAWVAKYYAEEAENFLRAENIKTDFQESFVRFDPLGAILAVMPWNFPFWQVIRFAAPALMAGNVGILKHASNVSGCSLAIETAFLESGFPPGVFQSFLISSDKVKEIIADYRIKAVTLTGSEYAGSQVAAQAGKLIKKSVLELGGSDPFIVLADADIPAACEAGPLARLQNTGQSCIAAKRFIVVAERYEEFLKNYLNIWQSIKIGDPLDAATGVGPLNSARAVEEVDQQVIDSVLAGAKILVGGKRWGEKGFFYEPTILTDVKKGMPAYDEEVFGPVAAVIKVQDTAAAIAVANDTPFGLGASLWTKDLAAAKELAKQINSGAVFINSMVKSDPRLPFGGIKKSGYGRELSSYGIKEFVNIKTVVIK